MTFPSKYPSGFPFMWGFLERNSYSSIPSGYNNPTSGLGGVVTNLQWGDIQPGATAPNIGSTVGSANFNADRNNIEGTTVGSAFAQIVQDLNGISCGNVNAVYTNPSGVNSANALVSGAQVKIRTFGGVGANQSWPNPPQSAWQVSSMGTFLSNDPEHTGLPFWINGTALAALPSGYAQSTQRVGDNVCSPTNGIQYTCQQSLTPANNTVDPGVSLGTLGGQPKWALKTNGGSSPLGYGGEAGPCLCWFGPSATNYLAAYAYRELLLANCRVWVNIVGYTTPAASDPTHVGIWTAGGIGGNSGTQFTLDTCPLIGEIPMTACTSIYGECTIRQISSEGKPDSQYLGVTNPSMIAAGYTYASGLASGFTYYNGPGPGFPSGGSGTASLGSGTPASPAPDSDLGMLLACQAKAALAWKETTVSEAHNPFQVQIGSDVQPGVFGSGQTKQTGSGSTTGTIIPNFIAQFPTGQAVVGNNSLCGPYTYDSNMCIYVGGALRPVYFQIQPGQLLLPNNGGTTEGDVLIEGMSVGANNLELSGGISGYEQGGDPTPPGSPTGITLAGYRTLHQGYITAGTGPPRPSPAPPAGAPATGSVVSGISQPAYTVAYSTAQTRVPSGSTAPVINSYAALVLTGTVGSPYTSFTFTATNSPTSWSVTNGALPDGMSLSNSGVLSLSGNFTVAGTFTFTVNATNASGTGSTAPITMIISGSGSLPVFINDTPPNGTLGVPYSYTFTATNTPTFAPGGVPHLTGFPLGLSLASNGVLSGTPYGAPGSWTASVAATNGSGTVRTPQINMNINDPATINPTDTVMVHRGGKWKPAFIRPY